jgi:hypothetical protein
MPGGRLARVRCTDSRSSVNDYRLTGFEIQYVRSLGADEVLDYHTQRFEDEASE